MGEEVENMPDSESGIHHFDNVDQVPYELQKYWHQRHNIFSKYDEGIWMTDDSWFGVTPEPVALQIADHISRAAPPQKKVLIDVFGGPGGNAIAFALSSRWDQIFVVEKDPEVLKCAKHNAEIYGVAKKIHFRLGDCIEVVRKVYRSLGGKAVIYGSPPWGGPGYRDDAIFNLETMQPYSIGVLYKAFEICTRDIVLYLPRTSNLNHLAKYGEEGKKFQVVHFCMNGASKALCAYYGDFSEI
ncbi:putative RNA methylase family protein [Tothia fuscella]|uniref:Trimethylguanosine synthase n=1 Tax=Tothia fuscella TaxID=1048955 RepID=A0A9P4NWR9_9PEZI|nr:putative RNA methylase family protein [Tothia fuscella]